MQMTAAKMTLTVMTTTAKWRSMRITLGLGEFSEAIFYPICTDNIEIDPPSKPSTGNVTASSAFCVART